MTVAVLLFAVVLHVHQPEVAHPGRWHARLELEGGFIDSWRRRAGP